MPTTTFAIPHELLKLIRGYKPFHVAKRIRLEATVVNCYEQIRPQGYTARPHLFLQLEPKESSSNKMFEYPQYYTPLELSLDLHLVREIYKQLKQGKTAMFSGNLTFYADWFFPLNRLSGALVGTISVDGKSYSVEFKRPSEGSNPRLKYICSK